jgi:hypothetical protein
MLSNQGIEIVAADSPGAFVEDTPTAILVRQVLGAVAQFDKAMTVAKLRLALDHPLITHVASEPFLWSQHDGGQAAPGLGAHAA